MPCRPGPHLGRPAHTSDRPLRQPVPGGRVAPRPTGRHRVHAADPRDRRPGRRPGLAVRPRRRGHRRRAHAPAGELLAPLRDPRPARRRARGAERQQPLAEQRRDADPRAGAARRGRRARRGPPALRPDRALRQQRRRVPLHVLPAPGARARRRAADRHRGRRPVRPQPVRAPPGGRDGVPGRPPGRGPLPPARDRPVRRRRGRPGLVRPGARPLRPGQRLRRAARRAALRRRVPRDLPRRAARTGGAHRRDSSRRGRTSARRAPPVGRDRRPGRSPALDRDRLPPRLPDRRGPPLRRPARSTRPSGPTARSGAPVPTGSTTARSGSDGSSAPRRGCRPGPGLSSRAEIPTTGSAHDAAEPARLLHRRHVRLPVRRRPDRRLARDHAARPRDGVRGPLRLPRRRRSGGRDPHVADWITA